MSKENKINEDRRKVVKQIAIVGTVITGLPALPEKWTRPLIEKVIVPAHAQTSPPPPTKPPTTPPEEPGTTPPGGPPTTQPPTTPPPTTEPPTTQPPTFDIEVMAYKRRIGGVLRLRDQGQCGDTLTVTAPNDTGYEAVVIAFVDRLPEPERVIRGYGLHRVQPFPGCFVGVDFKSPHG